MTVVYILTVVLAFLIVVNNAVHILFFMLLSVPILLYEQFFCKYAYGRNDLITAAVLKTDSFNFMANTKGAYKEFFTGSHTL